MILKIFCAHLARNILFGGKLLTDFATQLQRDDGVLVSLENLNFLRDFDNPGSSRLIRAGAVQVVSRQLERKKHLLLRLHWTNYLNII